MNEIDIETKVAFLKQPEAYGGRTRRVDAIETNMAWVFLTDREAYKLKKPARGKFLDYSTMEARRRGCEDEVRLNRRLAPTVYLGVVELVVGPDNALRIDAPGVAIDYLVRMRRLPAGRMLDKAIAMGTVTRPDITAVADLLVGFYGDAEPVLPAQGEFQCRFSRDLQASLAELISPGYPLPQASVLRVHSVLSSFLSECRWLFEERVGAGRIFEGHGDMRAEHVFLGPPPSIIDCLEFNRSLRIVDWAEEVSFLAVDCERLGATWIGTETVEWCCSGLGDRPPSMLIDFYKSFHAYNRARIAIRHLRDPKARTPERWPVMARRYLELALKDLPDRGG